MRLVPIAGGLAIATMLASCAGERLAAPVVTPATPKVDMAGRWLLSAPNAPACGMNFEGAQVDKQGTIRPEGGCPDNFFMSRHWQLVQGTLTINDDKNKPLAHLKFAGGRFKGQSTAGALVSLTR